MSTVRLEIRRFLTIQRVKFSNAFQNPFVCMEMRRGRQEGRNINYMKMELLMKGVV